jgi:nucleoside-diphosphate-sugar epimerase
VLLTDIQVTGYIGTHVADQFLKAGYVVIGTSRTASKAEGVKKYFETTYGPGKFEIYEAGDLQKEGVFDDAVKGNSRAVDISNSSQHINHEVLPTKQMSMLSLMLRLLLLSMPRTRSPT